VLAAVHLQRYISTGQGSQATAMADRHERQATGGFAARLRQVIEAYGSANSIAKSIDRSEGAVRKWLRGDSEPNVTDLRTLCTQTHTNVEWLVTGRGARRSMLSIPDPATQNPDSPLPVSYALLESVMDAIDVEVHRNALQLPSNKRSMLAVTLYELCRESGEVDAEAVARLVRLAR
jgi:hypothetical protein